MNNTTLTDIKDKIQTQREKVERERKSETDDDEDQDDEREEEGHYKYDENQRKTHQTKIFFFLITRFFVSQDKMISQG